MGKTNVNQSFSAFGSLELNLVRWEAELEGINQKSMANFPI